MASNDAVVLDSVLARYRTESQINLSESKVFELFSCEQVLKDSDLSFDEVCSGIIGGGDDGGIDAFYCLIDGELFDEDELDINQFRKSCRIDVFVIQAKQSPSFSETTIDKLIASLTQLFNFNIPMESLNSLYNSALLERISLFRRSYLALSALHARLHITAVYASKGDASAIHPKVFAKGEALKASLEELFAGSEASIEFLGARELLDRAHRQKTYTLQLKLIENPISTGEGAYVALANLLDYGAFISDESKALRKYIFESNVRDYQGDVDVNEDIRQTLEESSPHLNFWWLNNGVTILASKASIAAKTITLDDVQIVNGLQTTRSIYNYLNSTKRTSDQRSVLVKIIETNDPEARDRIIKATNYQTPIQPASLKATDRIQRDIETYLHQHGWFYDRRKNFYKNQGKPVHRIVGIPYLAQAVTAILLREPQNSRSRPSTLIKNEKDYRRVFRDDLSLQVYLACVEIMKETDTFVRYYGDPEIGYVPELARNFRFHIAMAWTAKLCEKWTYNESDILNIKDDNRSEKLADAAQNVLKLLYETSVHSEDRIAKSRDFVDRIIKGIAPNLSPQIIDETAKSRDEDQAPETIVTDEDIPF